MFTEEDGVGVQHPHDDGARQLPNPKYLGGQWELLQHTLYANFRADED